MTRTSLLKQSSIGLIFAILAESLLSPAGIHIVSPALPLLREEFHADPLASTLVPMVLTLPGLLIALCAPLMGIAADRLGIRPLLIGATLVYMTVGVLPYWLSSLSGIVVSRAVFGVAESALAVCGPPLIAAAFTVAGRRTMIGARLAVIGVASVAIALAGGWAAQFGWRWAFTLYGFAVVPLALILLFVPQIERQPPTGGRTAMPPSVLAGLSLTVIYGTGLAAMFVFVPFLLRDLGYTDPRTASSINGVTSVTTALASLAFPLIARALPRHGQFALSFALMAAGCVALFAASGQGSVALAAFTVAFGMGVFAPAITDLILSDTPSSAHGRVTGLMMMAVYIGNFLAPFAVNGLRGLGLSLGQAFVALAAVYLVALVASLALHGQMRGLAPVQG